MKTLILSIVSAIFLYAPQTILAQAIPADSVISIALSYINKDLVSIHKSPRDKEDYKKNFYIKDLSTGKPFAGEKKGLYVFAINGDDVPIWIMWQDATGYKVYEQKLDLQMLGEILEFCKRNNYSPEQSFRYIEGVYNTLYLMSITFL